MSSVGTCFRRKSIRLLVLCGLLSGLFSRGAELAHAAPAPGPRTSGFSNLTGTWTCSRIRLSSDTIPVDMSLVLSCVGNPSSSCSVDGVIQHGFGWDVIALYYVNGSIQGPEPTLSLARTAAFYYSPGAPERIGPDERYEYVPSGVTISSTPDLRFSFVWERSTISCIRELPTVTSGGPGALE